MTMTTFSLSATYRAVVGAALDDARARAPEWFADFEDSRLAVRRAADAEDAARLIATAPAPVLAGLVAGLYATNN